jgi:hypothetical protein
MVQQGQTIELTRRGPDGRRLWAYRFRTGGRDSTRIQRGGFASEQDARDALERELERLRRERRIARRLTLAELVETYLAQHDVQPVTIEKLRYLLSKATAVFGDRRIGELTSQEIAEWRMALSPGYRFEATQALRQVLRRAVAWGMIDINPAKVGVDNPVRRRKEQHPFESWAELEALAAAIGPRYGPIILFAAATGLRPQSGSPSRNATSIGGSVSSTCAAPSPAASSSSQRQRQARERCPCRPVHWTRSTGSRGQRVAAAVSRRARRLPRHPPLPTVPVAPRPEGGGHQSASAGLRSPAHLRDLRVARRNFYLRPLSLHGSQLDHDRPPLRPPRPRRREHAIKLLDALDAGWTLVDVRWTLKERDGVSAENESED